MNERSVNLTKELIAYIEKSPTAFQCVATTAEMLDRVGFTQLSEGEAWDLKPGQGYYVTRNLSSIIAFRMPNGTPEAFRIVASHSDSPTFALKAAYESEACGRYLRLSTERYGGMILSSWLDRPLSLAGRAIVRTETGFEARPVMIDRDLVLIPNVAIHQNRSVNDGFKYNPAVDLLPLFGESSAKGKLKEIIAEELGVPVENIAGTDLYLYCRTPGTVWGADDAFFSAPRIDNLMCAYSSLKAFLEAEPSAEDRTVSVCAIFDNEETGSETKQGAGSAMLHDLLTRIGEATNTDPVRLLASSFMVSADNGHAKHPNHPEFSDSQNSPHLNGGVVIKSNASQKYTTEALSASLFSEICRRADVPVQRFANRSDMLGGSTLGSISNARVPLLTIDIGMAQLAMHSCYETAGTADTAYLVDALREFYRTETRSTKDGNYQISAEA